MQFFWYPFKEKFLTRWMIGMRTAWDTLPKSIVNEHLPIGDMKVRDNDVFYMTKEWKNAIKAKRYQVPSKYRKLWRSSTLVKPQPMTRLTQEYLKSEAENYSTIA